MAASHDECMERPRSRQSQPAIAPTGPRSSRSTPSGGYTRFVDEIVALGAEVQRARCAIGERARRLEERRRESMVLTDGDGGVLPLRAAPGATERRRRDRIGPADGLSGTVERDFAAMRVKLLRGKDAAGVLLVYPSTLGEYGEAIEAIGRRVASGSAGPRSADAAYIVTTAA